MQRHKRSARHSAQPNPHSAAIQAASEPRPWDCWESTGKSVNGASQNYLNYRTPSGEVKKFYFSPCQYDEIAFLIERIDKDYDLSQNKKGLL